MDKNLRKICGMLQSPDGMRRCAAAMVLAELAPKDSTVVRALGEALQQGASQLLTRYILEAFDAIGTKEVVPYVLPLLSAEDLETKLRAVGIVARAGGDVLPEIKKQLATAGPQQKLVLADILARIHSRDAFQAILELLFDGESEVVKETCQAVRRHIGDATSAQRAAFHRQLVKFMGTARARKNERVLTSCLLLAGHIAAPEACKLLLKYATARHTSNIRRHALIALKNLEASGANVRTMARQLVKYLDEPDPAIAQHALEVVEKLPLPASYQTHWRKLLRTRHAAVRAFAARKLAATDDHRTNKLMLALLEHEDANVRETAASALARHKGATKLLLNALARERNPDAAWRLAKILKPHSEAVDKKAVKKFSALMVRDIAEGKPRYEALCYFLRNIDPRIANETLREAGLKFKKAQKWAQAVNCLRQLVNTESFDNEVRFQLSVCNLKQSPKDLTPHLRAEDHALRGIQALLAARNFPILERLASEPVLDAADLCYVGFHFAEQPGAGHAEFGRALLERVVQRWPNSKEAKAARNKLKLLAQQSGETTQL